MSQRSLILISALLFVASASFLFWQNERELDPDQGKDWWVIAFASPEDPVDLSFVLENHSDQVDFHYEIATNKTVLLEDTFSVRRGETLTIMPPLAAQADTRTTVIVSASKGENKKEIYR